MVWMKAHKLVIQNISFEMLLSWASFDQCYFLRSCNEKKKTLVCGCTLTPRADSLLSFWAALGSYVGSELHLHTASACLK